MADVLKRLSAVGPCRLTMALMIMASVALGGGCTAKRAVYIPSEWRTPQPPAAVAPRPQRDLPESGPAGPILPAPEFQERDLNAVPEKIPDTSVTPENSVAEEVPTAPGSATPASPQYLASMHLVSTAKTALNQGNTDEAIAQLEQAIQVDGYNAEAFFNLARAWQAKDDMKRALEFARKAEILYQDEPRELKKVYLLEVDLLKRTGQVSEAEIYRQKAARLEM